MDTYRNRSWYIILGISILFLGIVMFSIVKSRADDFVERQEKASSAIAADEERQEISAIMYKAWKESTTVKTTEPTTVGENETKAQRNTTENTTEPTTKRNVGENTIELTTKRIVDEDTTEPTTGQGPVVKNIEYTVEEETTETNQNDNKRYIGDFFLTAYWEAENGHSTSSGAYATEGRTVACNSLAAGSKIYIEGFGYYIVEDIGRLADDQIDIYFDDPHENFKVYGVPVYIVT